jgi:ATP-binding cassette subfamily B protein
VFCVSSSGPTPRQRLRAAFRLGRALRLAWQSAPGWTLANLALVVAQGAVPLASLYVMKRVLDAVTSGVRSADAAGAGRDVVAWILAALAVALSAALFRLLAEYATEAQSLQVTDAVAETLHAQSVAVDLAYYEDPSYYDTLHRAQAEAPYRPARIVGGLVQVGQNGIGLAGIAAWLVSINWMLAAALFAGVLPGALVRLAFSRRLYALRQSQTGHERRAWYYHELLTELAGAKELRLFGLGALFRERYADLRRSIRAGTLALAGHRAVADFAGQVVAVAALFGSLTWVAMQALRGRVSVADLAVYYVGFQTGLNLLQAVLQALAGLYEDNLFLANLYRFLDLQPRVVAPQRPAAVPRPMSSGIAFRGVAFRYQGQEADALSDIDLTLAPGEVAALVGENGSGKTTLAKLLCRLYDPTRGAITADGIDLRAFDPVAWRREISVTFQDYVHYALTARENIWLGDVTRPPDSPGIVEAGRHAGTDSFVSRLRNGYDTTLGRWFFEGQELSEGEWQRLAMARAFWREARILVLDEPSAALDPLAEADLLDRFRSLLAGRSALVISHRLSTVRLADRIHVLDRGRIVERGTHAELLALGGHYARLYEAQAQHYR